MSALEDSLREIVDDSLRRAQERLMAEMRAALAEAVTPTARRELLTVSEAVAQLGVGRGWLQRRVADGSLKRYGSGRIRVRPAEVLALLQREAAQAPAPLDIEAVARRLVQGGR